ncbi:MAG: hypothetical protein ABL949_04760 [Fimbriimonadaceae bacterium]
MVDAYISALLRVLGGFTSKLVALSLPLAIFGGLVIVALYLRHKDDALPKLRALVPYLLFIFVFCAGWTLLREFRDIQRNSLEWVATAEVTEHPKADAPQIYQYSPSVVRIVEKTYTRTLSLPPDLVQRIGTDGIGVLSPYLSDPTTENVLRMVDSFKRNGQDVLFTRQLTRMDEEPIGFKASSVQLNVQRSEETGYEAVLEGSYSFENEDSVDHELRFVFPLATGGATVRDLSLKVGSDTVTEPDDSGNYSWKGTVPAGGSRTAVVKYVASGSKSWSYDMGTTRRTVRDFKLTAKVDGTFRFPRGTIEPSARTATSADWHLSNVMTAQRIGLAFPKNTFAQDGYLQGLASLPMVFGLVLVVCMVYTGRLGLSFNMGQYLAAAVVLALAFLAVPVMYGYIGPLSVLLCPLAGALILGLVVDPRCAPAAMLVALVPGAMLSPTHSGILIVLVGLACGVVIWKASPRTHALP